MKNTIYRLKILTGLRLNKQVIDAAMKCLISRYIAIKDV